VSGIPNSVSLQALLTALEQRAIPSIEKRVLANPALIAVFTEVRHVGVISFLGGFICIDRIVHNSLGHAKYYNDYY
jgi:hypothetical protein